MNRRKFLVRSAITSALPLLEMPALSLAAFRQASARTGAAPPSSPNSSTLSDDLWQTLDQLQQHLLPDDTGQPPSLTRATSLWIRGKNVKPKRPLNTIAKMISMTDMNNASAR